MNDDLIRYKPMSCEKCKAAGTIVELGLCCRIRERDADWAMRHTHEQKRRLQLPPRRRPAP